MNKLATGVPSNQDGETKSEAPITVEMRDKGIVWTTLHHLQHTEMNCKISKDELVGLSRHVGNAVWPKDLNVVESTIEAHYPDLLKKVRQKEWSNVEQIPELFNVTED